MANDEIDITVPTMRQTFLRDKVMDYTKIVIEYNLLIVSKQSPHGLNYQSMVMVFSKMTWLCIGIVIMVAVILAMTYNIAGKRKFDHGMKHNLIKLN